MIPGGDDMKPDENEASVAAALAERDAIVCWLHMTAARLALDPEREARQVASVLAAAAARIEDGAHKASSAAAKEVDR